MLPCLLVPAGALKWVCIDRINPFACLKSCWLVPIFKVFVLMFVLRLTSPRSLSNSTISDHKSFKSGRICLKYSEITFPRTCIFPCEVMSYYPLHFLVSTLGAPMFIATDRLMNNSWGTTGMHAFLNYSLLQAWFPSEAEIWNPPTWFLSALSFANFTLPAILPQVARLSKDGLQKLLVALSTVSLLQKLSYSQAWKFYCCGGFAEKTAHPYLWNVTRFHPFGALVEIVTGAAAARNVMLDDENQKPSVNPLWLFLASYASLGLRLTTLNLNDAMIRTLLFMPLYTKFLMEIHRCTLWIASIFCP